MRIDVITLFPEFIQAAMAVGVVGRAQQRGLLDVQVWNPRDYATNNHRSVDGRSVAAQWHRKQACGIESAAAGSCLCELAVRAGSLSASGLEPYRWRFERSQLEHGLVDPRRAPAQGGIV